MPYPVLAASAFEARGERVDVGDEVVVDNRTVDAGAD
jgi:hypothetical protein